MRMRNATTHLIATLAVTASAVLAAFALPTDAHALTVSGNTVVGDGDGKSIAGSGKAVAVARQLGAFSVLRVDGPVDVEAHPGAHPGATIHADDNIEPLVETVLDGDTLVVRVRKGASFHTRGRLFVEVEFATLVASQQRGSGGLHINGMTAPKFDASISGSGDLGIANGQLGSFSVDVSGSGDVVLAGRADSARLRLAGSGDINATDLVARRVDVSIRGSGDAHVTATDAIDASIAGSGDIVYAGHPHDVSRRVTGTGSIEAAR
jgi:hypothetical protein